MLGPQLGNGAFASVRAATLNTSGRSVAVKVLLPEHASNPLAIAVPLILLVAQASSKPQQASTED